MNTATGLYIRMDGDVKVKAQKVASELGFSLSALIKAYVNQLIKTKKVDFSVDEELSAYTIRAMKRAKANRLAGKGSPVFDNAKDAIKYLEDQGI